MSKKLTNLDYCEAAKLLDVPIKNIKALAKVESGGRGGFDEDGRVLIRFEGHKFRGFTAKKYDRSNPGVSYPYHSKHRNCGKNHSYGGFNEAFALDPTAAMLATSFGMFQPMGFNHEEMGYDSVNEMLDDFKTGEKAQLLAFCRLIKKWGLADELRRGTLKDFTIIAKRYNGEDYASNNYHNKMFEYSKQYAKENIDCSKVSTDTKQPAQTISTNLPEIPADSTAEPVEVPDTVLSSDETVPAITETTKTTEKETDEGTETVETKAEVQQTISIEKPAPKGFIAKIKAKIAGLFGGAVGMDVITEKAAQANTLGLSPDTWKRIFYVALFAALAYLIYELVDHIISMKRDKEITNELIKANTTDTNIVQLVDAEKLQALKAQGYEIVKR